MKCPKCRFENPDTQKFCGECGERLEKACPNCGNNNPPQYKFCGECGCRIDIPSEVSPKDLSFDEKIEKLQRYLPKGLTEKILSQRDKIEGERKQVTVMFADMEGFTSLSERLGPEEAYTVMDQVYEILIHKVHDYEGTVNEMTGDGIMALFGAPIALEDAPQRAIRSAYAIHREMTKFSDKIKQEKQNIPPIKMRIPLAKQVIEGVYYRKYDLSLCTYCAGIYGLMLAAIRYAWKGDPWDKVEVLTGKAMQPTPGMEKTILVGKCIYQAHKDNPDIKEMIAVKGCPPKPKSLLKAFHQAGIEADPSLFENVDKLPGFLMRRYEGKPEFEETFFQVQ